jgi:hypothetical protein
MQPHEARDEAIERVSSNSLAWRTVAHEALEAVCYRQLTVTSDDVWAELERMDIPRPDEARAMGPVMMRGVRLGLIVPHGFTQGTNPRHHADVMRVYRSLAAIEAVRDCAA